MFIQPPKIIPLYVPATQEIYDTSFIVVSPEPKEGLTLLSSDNKVSLSAMGLDDIGHLQIMIFDTAQQAQDAHGLLAEFSKFDNEGRNFSAGVAPSGEGILFIQNPNAAVFEYDVVDRRAPSETHADEWLVSADLDAAQFDRIKEEIEEGYKSESCVRQVAFIASQIESAGLTQDVQLELERRKGGYVAVNTLSPESFLAEQLYTQGGVYGEVDEGDVRKALIEALEEDDISTEEQFQNDVRDRLYEIVQAKSMAAGPKL